MTLMTEPENDSFKALLKDYSAPVDDDGFTDSFLASLGQRQIRLQRIKFIFLAAGFFTGGIIAAAQMPKVWSLIANIHLPASPVPIAAFAALFAFIVWATLDSKAGDIA